MNALIVLHASVRPGTDIKTAFQEAINVATKVYCEVKFDFNGVTCFARPDSKWEIGVDRYNEELAGEGSLKIATSHPRKPNSDYNPVSSLDGVQIMVGRRVGNTTRVIDNIIQLLFQGKRVRIADHSTSRGAIEALEHRLIDRLRMEHRNVEFDFDRNEGIISLKR